MTIQPAPPLLPSRDGDRILRRFPVGLVIATALLVGLACGGAKGEPPIVTATPTSTHFDEIPEEFNEFTDKSNLFSISYPSDWVLLETLSDLETRLKDVLPEVVPAFSAGLPNIEGHNPNVHVAVGTLPTPMFLDQFVDWNMQGINVTMHSRNKMEVGGKEAVLVDVEVDVPIEGRLLGLFMLDGDIGWILLCGDVDAIQGGLQDCDRVIRSFRILRTPTSSIGDPLDDFVTFTDESNLFSISYPSDWEVNIQKDIVNDIIRSKRDDTLMDSLEAWRIFFIAKMPGELVSTVNISVAPFSREIIVEEIDAIWTQLGSDLEGVERVVIGDRETIVRQWKIVINGEVVDRFVTLVTVDGKFGWNVNCGQSETSQIEISQELCVEIVKSFRLLQ